MRVLADIASNSLIRVQSPSATLGATTTVNGQYVVPIPEGASVDIGSTSYVLPVNANSIPGQSAAGLLSRYPMYSYAAYNFLVRPADVADLDLTATGPGGVISRAVVGRSPGPNSGIAPNSTIILPQNNAIAPARPGCLVTAQIDTTPISGGPIEEALLWWEIASFSTSEDIVQGYGPTAGTNSPALRSLVETDQEPAGLTVSMSNDDGANWFAASRLSPVNFGVFDNRLRIAWVNTSANRIYLLAFVVLF